VELWRINVLIFSSFPLIYTFFSYEMLVGIPPFYHQNQHVMYQYITTKNIIFPDAAKYKIPITEEAKDLISKVSQFNSFYLNSV
jgi:hypothetical protein